MNLLRNISQVFPVDLHWMISPVPVAPRLLLFSQASTDTRPSASRVGARTEPRVSCVRLLPCSSECDPRQGGRGREGGAVPRAQPLTSGSGTDGVWWVCTAPVSCPQVAEGGGGGMMWGELMMMRCSHYAAQCSSFSYHFPVSAFFSLFFLISQTN